MGKMQRVNVLLFDRQVVDEVEKDKVYWKNQSPQSCIDPNDEVINLVMPTSVGVSEQLRFAVQLNEILHERDSFGMLVRMVPSRSYGTVFEIRTPHVSLNGFLNKIGNIPEVEKVEDNANEGSAFHSYPRKFKILFRKAPSLKIDLQSLGEANGARQELATMLN